MNTKGGVFTRLEQFYYEARGNKWFHYFAIFCRVMLALGFIISGLVKVTGERFASGLPVNNPMGHYLQALYETGYYYTFIGIAQLVIAILLLIPRTNLLGAILYLPVILNICMLAYATRFEGSPITMLMLLANLYLLCWDYDRLKYIVSLKRPYINPSTTNGKPFNNKFPFAFFGSVFLTAVAVIAIIFLYDIRPGNSSMECTNGCKDNKYPKAANAFCDCIYNQGKPLDSCLAKYEKAKEQEERDSMNRINNK